MKKLVWILMKQLMDKTGARWERAVVKSHYGSSEANYEEAITSAVSCIHDPANFDQTANAPPPGRQRTLQRSCTRHQPVSGKRSKFEAVHRKSLPVNQTSLDNTKYLAKLILISSAFGFHQLSPIVKMSWFTQVVTNPKGRKSLRERVVQTLYISVD